jgi:anti-sigma B factor antagonist
VPGVRYLRKMINGVPVVTAPAGIDIAAAGQLCAVLLDTAARGHTTVVVDMSGTVFCHSSGLHTVLRAHKRAVAEGGELRLVVPADGAVPRILNLTGLDLFLPCFSSVAGALAPALAPAVHMQPGALAGLPRLSPEPRS